MGDGHLPTLGFWEVVEAFFCNGSPEESLGHGADNENESWKNHAFYGGKVVGYNWNTIRNKMWNKIWNKI